MRSLNTIFSADETPQVAKAPLDPKGRAEARLATHRWSRRRQLAAAFSSVLLVLLLIIAVLWAEQTGRLSFWSLRVQESGHNLLANQGFFARNITLHGSGFTTQGEVTEALDAYDRQPLSKLNPQALAGRLQALPWVTQATVQRRWPNTLNIWLQERTPLAVLHRADGPYMVDQTGAVILPADQSLIDGYPNIAGEGAAAAVPELLAYLRAAPEIYGRLVGATYVSGRRWNLYLDPGVEIKLSEANIGDSLGRLLALQANDQILNRDISTIDLRGRRDIVVP